MGFYCVSDAMKALFVALLILTIPVFAVHTSNVALVPQFSGAVKEVQFSLNITNIGKDNVSEVRVRMPVDFSLLECSDAPVGWTLAYSDAIECNYKTVSKYIAPGVSLIFWVNATTASKSGNYTWEVRTRDVFDGFSLHNPVTMTDAAAPAIKPGTLKTPNGGETWEASSRIDIQWSFKDITDDNLEEKPITLEYTDGKTWKMISQNEENDGAYTWTVPDSVTDNARVRLTAMDKVGNTASDESDKPFSISPAAPTVTIKVGETRILDANNDGKNDTIITVRSVTADAAVLLINAVTPVTPVAVNVTTPAANVSKTPVPDKGVLSNPTVTAIVVILILIILYLIWRVQQLEKKKK